MLETRSQPDLLEQCQGPFPRIPISALESQGRQQGIFQYAVLRQQVVILKDKADFLIAEKGQFWLGQGKGIPAIDPHLARRGPVQGADQVQ